MPKRSNPFQHLAYLINQQLADGAVVTESKELVNRVTRETREVDIVIERSEGAYPVTIGVECTATKDPADVSWVEEMRGKHLHLPTDRLVLVSEAGFTEQARRLAAFERIELITLDEAAEADWNWLIDRIQRTFIATLSIPTKEVRVIYTPAESADVQVLDSLDQVVYTPDGAAWGPLKRLIGSILEPRVHQLMAQLEEGIPYKFHVEQVFNNGIYLLDEAGQRCTVCEIHIWGVCLLNLTTLSMTRQSSKGAAVATSSPGIGGINHVVMVERPGRGAGATVEYQETDGSTALQIIDFSEFEKLLTSDDAGDPRALGGV